MRVLEVFDVWDCIFATGLSSSPSTSRRLISRPSSWYAHVASLSTSATATTASDAAARRPVIISAGGRQFLQCTLREENAGRSHQGANISEAGNHFSDCFLVYVVHAASLQHSMPWHTCVRLLALWFYLAPPSTSCITPRVSYRMETPGQRSEGGI